MASLSAVARQHSGSGAAALEGSGRNYRPDLDGLRSLAIIPVVLFHADILGVPGGFVGVDVFFVISGYLITSSILSDNDRGRFSIADFYHRRVKRIAPALVLVLFTSLVAAMLLLDPVQALAYGKSLVAAVPFLSNVFFYGQRSYFDAASEYKPLLNLWSLAVEEQFYIVFPVLMMLLFRWHRRTVPIALTGLICLSFAFALWQQGRDPAGAFYLPFGRAWELLLGSLLALGVVPQSPQGRVRTAGALIGIGAILAAAAFYTATTPFPGMAALVPCVGAALVIHSAQGTIAGRLLASPVPRRIGQISYALYLWHWPLLAFARNCSPQPLAFAERVGLVVVSFILATLTTRFVERPIRGGLWSRRALFIVTAVSGAALLASGATIVASQGAAFRQPAEPAMTSRIPREAAAFQASPCLVRNARLPAAECRIGRPGTTGAVVLWGDSHAAQLAPAMAVVADRLGVAVDRFTKAACPPVFVGDFVPQEAMRTDCGAFNAAVMAALEQRSDVRLIVLAARWDGLASGSLRAVDREAGARLISVPATLARFASQMAARGVPVVVVGAVPLPARDPASCWRAAAFIGRDPQPCARYDAAQANAIDEQVRTAILDRARSLSPSLKVIPLHDLFCSARGCVAVGEGAILYQDVSHLSAAGARRTADRIAASISAARARPDRPNGR